MALFECHSKYMDGQRTVLGTGIRQKPQELLPSLLLISCRWGPAWLPQRWAPRPHAQMPTPALTAHAVTDKPPYPGPSFSFKFIKHTRLPLPCRSFSWQREISKPAPKPDVVLLNLLVLAMLASGLKFTSYSHPAVSLLSFIPSLALPLLYKYNNAYFLSVWGFCVLLAASSTSHRREERQTCNSITLLQVKHFENQWVSQFLPCSQTQGYIPPLFPCPIKTSICWEADC